jgi:hypothetical protein
MAGSGKASSSSSAPSFSFSPSTSRLKFSACFQPLFLEAGVADAVPVPAVVAFLLGVLGCGVVLLLLVWRVEERAPYLLRFTYESQCVIFSG